MSREIKFRALSKSGIWYYSVDEAYVLRDIEGRLLLMEMVNFYNDKDIELCVIGEALQYTGLSDKNNVEIYEGDIVRNSTGAVHVVNYNKELGRYQFSKHPFDKYSHVNLEVIGNTRISPVLWEEEDE